MRKLKKILDQIRNFIDRLPVDNKLVYSGISGAVSYVLTYAITKAGLDLNQIVIAPWTISAIVAVIAAGAAGYLASNEATVIREPEKHDGNPDETLARAHGLVDKPPARR